MSQPSTSRSTQPEQVIDLSKGAPAGAGVTAVLDSMVRNTEEREQSFARALRDQVSNSHQANPTSAPVATMAAPARTHVEPDRVAAPAQAPQAVSQTEVGIHSPSATPSGAEGDATARSRFSPARTLPQARTDVLFSQFTSLGRPNWRHQALVDLGLPEALLEVTSGLDPDADLKWIEALVRAANPVCALVTEQSSMIVSTGHLQLADVLGLPIHRPGDLPPYGGSIYCVIGEDLSSSDLEWLDRVKGDRGVHVIIEAPESEKLITMDATAVSYASEAGAAIALKWAIANGIGLMFGVTHDGTPLRATAFDVALAIRSWMRGV